MPDQATPTNKGFSLNDLRALQHIVDVCTTRGAFKAEELTAIGLIYDRLTSFLAASDAAVANSPVQHGQSEQGEAASGSEVHPAEQAITQTDLPTA